MTSEGACGEALDLDADADDADFRRCSASVSSYETDEARGCCHATRCVFGGFVPVSLSSRRCSSFRGGAPGAEALTTKRSAERRRTPSLSGITMVPPCHATRALLLLLSSTR